MSVAIGTLLANAVKNYVLPAVATNLASTGVNSLLGAIGLNGTNTSTTGGGTSSTNTATNNTYGSSTSSGSNSTSSGTSSTSSLTNTTGSSVTTGNTSGISSLYSTATGTATGSNWDTAALYNLGSSLLGNVFNALSQTSSQSYNAEQSALSRAWSQDMRQTAYQDTVEDLKAAGLNPALAYLNGATSTSSGSSASSGAQSYSMPSMSAMYEYGNNTANFLQNAQEAINSSKQSHDYQSASAMQSITSEYMQSASSAYSAASGYNNTDSITGGNTYNWNDTKTKNSGW